MKKIIKNFIKLIKKYCYISIPVITVILITAIGGLKIYTNIIPDHIKINFNDDMYSSLIGISGTLIGFLFTAMTIFFSLNKNSTYMEKFMRYNHHIIFSRLVMLGILCLCINIFCWLFNVNQYIIIISFIFGLEETVMAAYYTYKLSLNSLR